MCCIRIRARPFIFFIIVILTIVLCLYYSHEYSQFSKRFVSAGLDSLFDEEDRDLSEDIFSILVTSTTFEIVFVYPDDRNITIFSNNHYSTFRSFDSKVEIPIAKFCKEPTTIIEYIIHSKLLGSTFRKHINCKASLFEDIKHCIREPINSRCIQTVARVVFLVYSLFILSLVYIHIIIVLKIYDMFISVYRRRGGNELDKEYTKQMELLVKSEAKFIQNVLEEQKYGDHIKDYIKSIVIEELKKTNDSLDYQL